MTWLVVHFLDTDEVEVVPCNWYRESTKECSWPPYKSRPKIVAAIKSKTCPSSNWLTERGRVMGKYETFDTANKKCKKAKDTDNLSSHPETPVLGKGFRKRTRPQRLLDDDCSTDDEETFDEVSLPDIPASLQKSSLTNLRTKPGTPSSTSSPIERSVTGLDIFNTKRTAKPDTISSRDRSHSKYSKKDFHDPTAGSLAISDSGSVHSNDILSLQAEDNRKQLSKNTPIELKSRIMSHMAQERGKLGKENQRHQSEDILIDLNSRLMLHMAQEKEFRKVVLEELYLNNRAMETLVQSIDLHLLQNKSSTSGTKQGDGLKRPMPILEKCPIKNQEDLRAMEDFLKNPKNVEDLIRDLSRLGGSNLKEVTKRMCFAVVDDKIAVMYSWDGAKGKKKFRELRLASAIQKAILSDKKFISATEHDITAIIKSWLVGAIGRSKKQNRDVENNQNDTTSLDNEDEASSAAESSCNDSHLDNELREKGSELVENYNRLEEKEAEEGDVPSDGH